MSKPKKTLPPVIKVAIVDDQLLFRAGIMSLLKDYDDIYVAIEAVNGKDLLEKMRRVRPHVVLLDIEMPTMNGIDTIEELKKNHPKVYVIMLTLHAEPEYIFDMIKRGAHGYLKKDHSVEEVIHAIYKVMETGKYHNEMVTEALTKGIRETPRYSIPQLSDKEVEIIRLICKEKNNHEIGDELGISPRTIENIRAAILNKTGTKNTAGMVVYAIRHKIISYLDLM